MKILSRWLLVGWIWGCFVAPVRADEPPEIATDRPDQTESPTTLAPGWVQLETGWTWTRDTADGVRVGVQEVPGTLLRFGLVPRLELRLAWAGWVGETTRVHGRRSEDDGLGDAELGVKIGLLRDPAGSEIALLVSTSLPVGERPLSSERFDPALRLAVAHALNDQFDLGFNLGIAWESELDDQGERDTLSAYLYTVALGRSLSARWSTFVELFGELPASASGKPCHSFDLGLTYRVRNTVQLDVSAGVGLSAEAADRFFGLGVSVLWPR